MTHKVAIIGYSGHAYVICDILLSQKVEIIGYCDRDEKVNNPFDLKYLGAESKARIEDDHVFIAIGNNAVRKQIVETLKSRNINYCNAIHDRASISTYAQIGTGNLINNGAIINAMTHIGNHCIINTGAIVEHDCAIDSFVHIGPGAVLAGGVSIGQSTLIGANAVVKEGTNIGQHCTIGAGSVIIQDVDDHCTVVGNPGRIINKR